ncbi:MAG TPA: ATP-binding protein, partial [Prolixibacteraceae bacterium]|nr:ATP-binding protein [Prolixibacteraceae bacterium]
KQIENELLRKNTLLKLTGETAQIGGWEFDTETKILNWTEEVYHIHEVDFTFNINISIAISFYAPASRLAIKDALNMVIEYGEPFDLELELITEKGNHRWVQSIGKSYQENGKTKKVYGSFQDITDRKRVEFEIQNKNEELRKVNAEKDKFFSIIAHDLRSPLSGFMGLTEILAEGSLNIPIEELHKLALAMKNSATNVFRLLGNLLEWSRMQRGLTVFVPELLLLNSVISESMIQITEDAIKKDITIDFEIPGDLCVFADKNMLDSILRNLVSNAVKFTPKGGRITVSAQSDFVKMAEILIEDTGIGMNKEMITKLFRLDTNTNRKGTEGEYSTGLGLVICKDFIEKQGGKLLVESEEGKGSIFKFALPIMSDKEEIKVIKSIDPDEKPIHLTNQEFSGLKILIAEDDEASELFISHSVQKLSKEIIKVRTGIDAVEVCCSNPDIDIVLMDIKMPEMDGYEATRQIRLFNNKVVIIAETAYALKGDREIALTAGCNDHITKPFGKFKLISLMKKHLKLKQSIYSHS